MLVLFLIVLGPLWFVISYQQLFGYDSRIVLFNECFMLTCMLCALLGLSIRPARSSRKVSRWLFVLSFTILSYCFLLIDAGAYLSNVLWGDTLNYRIVATLLGQVTNTLDFIPIAVSHKKWLFTSIGFLLLAIFFFLLVAYAFIAGLLVPRRSAVDYVLDGSCRHPFRISLGLALAISITSGTCAAIAFISPGSLLGEPISSFFKLSKISNALQLDSSRLAALLEDKISRAEYPVRPKFVHKNVVLVISDSLRADRMGVYGYHRDTTPFLSKLWKEGKLHRVDMALSTCSESFCGIASTLASRPFHQISSYNFKLHSLLRSLGYRVHFYLSGDHRAWNYLWDFYGDDIDVLHDHKAMKAQDANEDRNLLGELERLEFSSDRPSFFYFFLMSSHAASTKYSEFEVFSPARFERMRLLSFWNEIRDTRRLEGKVISERSLEADELAALSNRYDNGVLQADSVMERVFHVLTTKGYMKDTIVVIIGDHGDGLGEHGHVGHTRYLYQEDIHIPFLIYDADPHAYKTKAFGTQLDVAPTIIDRLGLPVPASWQGRSLLQAPSPNVTLHQTRRGNRLCRAVVKWTDISLFKYIRCDDSADHYREELFNLSIDPSERQNLITAVNQKFIAEFRRELTSRFDVFVNRCENMECQD